MPNEKKTKETQEKVEKQEPVNTEKVETETKEAEVEKTEQVESTEKEAQKGEEKVEETKEVEEKEEKQEANTETEEQKEEPIVEQEKSSYNAIRVDDLMTKEEFNAQMAAFAARFEALVKENADLKEQNAQLLDGKQKAESETENMKNKYERNDFGNIASKNIGSNGGKEKTPYQSFDEYSKQFM